MGLLNKAAVKQSPDVVAKPQDEARAAIENYHQAHPSFHCIVLEQAEAAAARAVLTRIGLACALPSGDCLALVPADIDRELLAHRLSKSLNAKILCQYGPGGPGGALKALAAWL